MIYVVVADRSSPPHFLRGSEQNAQKHIVRAVRGVHTTKKIPPFSPTIFLLLSYFLSQNRVSY